MSTRAERARVEATPGETARPSKCARATSPPTAAPSYREPPENRILKKLRTVGVFPDE